MHGYDDIACHLRPESLIPGLSERARDRYTGRCTNLRCIIIAIGIPITTLPAECGKCFAYERDLPNYDHRFIYKGTEVPQLSRYSTSHEDVRLFPKVDSHLVTMVAGEKAGSSSGGGRRQTVKWTEGAGDLRKASKELGGQPRAAALLCPCPFSPRPRASYATGLPPFLHL